mmetsp:Transcript_8701/g.9886  ORF Transcript_8701/g.9886 Transcript_8701/m.9886 type:complete len:94 (-) Transcript_8701:34-315(-)
MINREVQQNTAPAITPQVREQQATAVGQTIEAVYEEAKQSFASPAPQAVTKAAPVSNTPAASQSTAVSSSQETVVASQPTSAVSGTEQTSGEN